MKILVVLNMRGTAMGLLGKAITEAGGKAQYCAAYCGEKLSPSPDGFAGMVIMGGEQNALDDAGSPHFPALLDLIRAFDTAKKPVLGICLGAQLIARAFGGQNIVGGAAEFAWQEVELTPEGKADPLMAGLPERFVQFQWHDDTFTLPEGAVRLAGNERVSNEAFRVGNGCYGLQFHSEAGRATVYDWSTMLRDIILEKDPDWLKDLDRQASLHADVSDRASTMLLRNWVNLLAA
ncbi:type 1 glutamine amidotransferase [Rhizobium sp. L1K21]|uniref:type 1 glutamine amidotransferase n=1 Tax=Rhizobium sp. L1K21 TaxID=2954933 RepID=UPI002092A9E5|nr:type 1 glutamine amidotransferase [Rhizobium sp. L1K21]MCO6187442.1 type 1 glutamine amidotransferase [Rhizobium sp. L1K21]